MIHGAEKKSGLIPKLNRNALLFASDEDVTWLYYNDTTQK